MQRSELELLEIGNSLCFSTNKNLLIDTLDILKILLTSKKKRFSSSKISVIEFR